MIMKPNTTAYDTDYGVMKGTTKYMPQRAWNSIGKNNGDWSRQTAVPPPLTECTGSSHQGDASNRGRPTPN